MLNPSHSCTIKLPRAVKLYKAMKYKVTKSEDGLQKLAKIPTKLPSKQSVLINLLSNSSGATLLQMVELTAWQAYSVWGIISGVLRKKQGLNVICDKVIGSDARLYRIVPQGA